MKKKIKVVKKGQDQSNLQYWISLSKKERLEQLEEMRQQINSDKYETRQGFQRIYRVIKRTNR